MGCCLSTQTPKTKKQLPAASPPRNHRPVSKSPPRAEEEAVKEVLSETPKPVIASPEPISVPIPNPNPNPYYYTPIPKINHSLPRKPHPPLSPPPDQTSEVSDVSCLSESVSTATAEVLQAVPVSSKSGQIHNHAVRRERVTGKSPVRRANPSPVRNRVGEGQRRRELGENSGRRSRSPVVSRGRKAGISPGRVRMVESGVGYGCRKKEEDDDPTAPTESLENPLVSLECFIFL